MLSNVLFARFDDPSQARTAARALRRALRDDERARLVARRTSTEQSWVSLAESDARRGLLVGAMAGGLAGALAGMTSALLLGATPAVLGAALIFGGLAGGAFGLLGGSLSGLSRPSSELSEVIEHADDGQAILTIAVEDEHVRAQVSEVMEAHGAREVSLRAA